MNVPLDEDEAHEETWRAEEKLRKKNKKEITNKVFEKLYRFRQVAHFDSEIRRTARDIVNLVLNEWKW